MGVKLTSAIPRSNIQLGHVALAHDLDIVRCLSKVHAVQCTLRDKPRAAAGLGAVAHDVTFSFTDCANCAWTPQAKVRRRVNVRILTL